MSFESGDHKMDAAEMPNLVLGTQRITERSDPKPKDGSSAPNRNRSAMIENLRMAGSPRGKQPD